ncbi:carbamoyl-phosphate synthase (glutamine-hydrolyzing) large subunit [Cuniculiplasma sp. SKW3]|uniref:carbamoyl-phosphate synthase (glutamine-hydrolyzing) large subunit n=1 Tax=Cuniculiplasma sp. SKW3 TaxID=3400170 RepID=UPI003FD4FA7E
MQSGIEKRVLVIGSGPVVIGQAAEFDYAGSQACRILKELGYYTVLLNSNPATIQTDWETADKVYIKTINVKNAAEIIRQERINGIVPGMAGQTGLNILLELKDAGILDRYNVEILGTPPEGIRMAEDRTRFHEAMVRNGIKVPESKIVHREKWKEELEEVDFYPFIARTSFTLGGKSGKILESRDEAKVFFEGLFSIGSVDQVEIERSLKGMIEMEYEVMRDLQGNSIMICNMENLDPMGIHTGESVVVTPSLTIPDRLHQEMRREALKIAEILMIRGACNVQFAVDLDHNEIYAIEANPRTSRSSALASKATGYPIAKIATYIVCGHPLTEIRNPITGNTSAAFEPSQDYVTVKIPLWPDTKFTEDMDIGVSMKSVGETMGIGRNFEEAFFKALVSLEIDLSAYFKKTLSKEEIIGNLSKPSSRRFAHIISALINGIDIREISNRTGWSSEILVKLQAVLNRVKVKGEEDLWKELAELKKIGLPDRVIYWITGIEERDILQYRIKKGILPAVRMIDSSSGEYRSDTRYAYSTYGERDDIEISSRESVLIMGSGPNRIAQGLEFDYSSVKAVREIRRMGLGAIMINSNPETVSTDFDTSDELYFDPLVPEYVCGIIMKRKVKGIIIQFAGQTGQNMASIISEVLGKDIILGTSSESIEKIENRELFSAFLKEKSIIQPEWVPAHNGKEIEKSADLIGLPIIVRSSFIIGGSLFKIIRNREELLNYVNMASSGSYHVSRYIENAREYDLDFISNGKEIQVCGIMEHLEEAGVHSGDAISIMGRGIPEDWIAEKATEIARTIGIHFGISGFGNLQFMEKGGEIYIIEMNARASRTIPVISKFTGINWVGLGISAILTGKMKIEKPEYSGFCAKIPVFPFDRFENFSMSLGPEMRSTGEAMVFGSTIGELREKIKEEIGYGGSFILYSDGKFQFHDGINTREINREQASTIIKDQGRNITYFETAPADEEIRRMCYQRKIPVIQGKRAFDFINGQSIFISNRTY